MFEVTYDNAGAWVRIDEKTIRKALANTYTDVDTVIDELKAGYETPTSFARYRYTERSTEIPER